MQKMRLYCLPYAGGSSYVFSKWIRNLHPDIELVPIEYPGRGRRILEPLISNSEELVNDIFENIKDGLDDLPYILLGHSMGSLLAYELVYKILKSNNKGPTFIIFSGTDPLKCREKKIISTLPHEEFVQEVLAMGGTPKEVFSNKEMAEIYIPILRSDFQLVESYRAGEYQPLDIDLFVFYGKNDYSTDLTILNEWKFYTTKSCHFSEFEGGHFFIHDNEREVIEEINQLVVKLQTV
ncbi:thioesterase II family protein [Metabacillus malikii]|uniref:Surfactin synthase thioesterase subunit n=1 Tax=Metabacillus malikii TaxID=1504265 RepID=A0ABT9ZKQ6_9BACI|nr:thioesterase domain-containing protein [Metabacillus malikii]MDQ0232876.1 surfactin synthase thioesterase subunit [Metabacillus malikii]